MRIILKISTIIFLIIIQCSCGSTENKQAINSTDQEHPVSIYAAINNGNSTTTNTNVSVSLSANDNIGIIAYYISEEPDVPLSSESGWISVTSTKSLNMDVSFVLSAESQVGSYQKTIYVWFKDAAGNVSDSVSDVITFDLNDTILPVVHSVTINNGSNTTNTVNVSITVSASDNNGITGYYLSDQNSTPTIQTSGWIVIVPASSLNTNIPFVFSNEQAIGSYEKNIYFWVKDEAGNISTYGSDTISFVVGDIASPVNISITLNNGDLSTTSKNVTASLNASDNIAITDYILSENFVIPDLNSSSWINLSIPVSDLTIDTSFELSNLAGSKTVYSWFKDALGNISNSASSSIELIAPTSVDIGNLWMFFGDSQTDGRSNEPSAKSHVTAFTNIWNQTFTVSESPFVNGVSGRILEATRDYYLSRIDRNLATLVHFQESGSQKTSQDTAQKFVQIFESMVRSIVSDSPNAIISTETAYSFEAESEPNRDWTQYNIQMISKISELQAEGIAVYLAQVDRNIKELVIRKRAELGTKDGQEVVWGDTDNVIGRHYTGLGNLMVALSIYDSLGYDVNLLDLSVIPENEISSHDKQLCIEIINSF